MKYVNDQEKFKLTIKMIFNDNGVDLIDLHENITLEYKYLLKKF